MHSRSALPSFFFSSTLPGWSSTCDDVLQDAVLSLAHLRLHLPLLQLSYQVHLWHLGHHRTLDIEKQLHFNVLNAAQNAAQGVNVASL